ncbi:MAG: hypothetical protein IJQ34_00815, partial [Kiritimatiellae bacterium]|nr:hypothetical protein [Kiritimatiellia bacterium]
AECGKSARMHLRPIGASRSGPHFRLSMNRKTMIAAPKEPPSSPVIINSIVSLYSILTNFAKFVNVDFTIG